LIGLNLGSPDSKELKVCRGHHVQVLSLRPPLNETSAKVQVSVDRLRRDKKGDAKPRKTTAYVKMRLCA
jgi:hypothetical protein